MLISLDDTTVLKDNIYKDPRISQEATEHFFRSLFDFLEGNEGAKNG